MKITKFRGEWFFLSNFYETKVTFEGLMYNNAESAFQAMKCRYYDDRIKFFSKTGTQAKQIGKRIRLRDDWESVKLDYMYKIIKAKFEQNDFICRQLIDTGDSEIEEHNDWSDTYWGICNGCGENHLGKILMQVRDELKDYNK